MRRWRAGGGRVVVVLAGDEDRLDELAGYVACKANHKENRRRRKRLDAAFEALSDALRRPRGRAGTQ